MKKIRIYNLARELKQDVKRIIEDARQLGSDASVASNSVPLELAEIVRLKYISCKKTSLSTPKVKKKQDIKKIQKESYSSNKKKKKKSKSLIKKRKLEILLKTKKAKRINETKICARCNVSAKIIWQYTESNIGKVNLCSSCKPIVYSKSFGSGDAMKIALQGGQFESNRRKH